MVLLNKPKWLGSKPARTQILKGLYFELSVFQSLTNMEPRVVIHCKILISGDVKIGASDESCTKHKNLSSSGVIA